MQNLQRGLERVNQKLAPAVLCLPDMQQGEKGEGMKDYYFTYGIGSTTQPFRGGYSLVKAKDVNEAINKHIAKYGTNAGLVRCAFWYDEHEFNIYFKKDRMVCHEIIE